MLFCPVEGGVGDQRTTGPEDSQWHSSTSLMRSSAGVGTGSRCSCAADGGPAVGVPEARRPGYRRAQDPSGLHSSAKGAAPQMVEQLVEVPVPESVLVACGTDFAGVEWRQFRAGSSGVWDARSTPGGGNARLGSPPAQGGIQILDKAEAVRRPLVVHVPVLFSDKFLQSKEFHRLVPQIQFISRVWDFLLWSRDEYARCQTVQKISPGAVLGRMSTRPLLCNDRVTVRTVQKTVLVPQLQFNDVGSIRCDHAAPSSNSFQCPVLSCVFRFFL